MATYLMLLNWTDQGIKNVKESPKRLDAARKLAKDLGGEIKTVYMTQGNIDLALIAELPNDEKLATFVLKLGSLGNVRTTTLKAYTEEEYRKIIGGLD
ncbi:MAG: GYD domain-containing protein [Nitrospira sp. CR1.3]|nr:GYD domain-containing protein [Nitrospira sp. CR1.3]